MNKVTMLIIAASLALVACGVDTTGLSAASSRKPIGSDNALVLVWEYADLQCPACKTAHTLITKPLLEQYAGSIRFEFKHFPLLGTHANALEAAQALECAADQGKFWEYLELAYDRQESLSSAALREWASVLGLDGALFDRCVRSGIKKDTVLADLSAGEKIGVNQTPTYLVNGVKVTDATLSGISAVIDAALKQIQQVPL